MAWYIVPSHHVAHINPTLTDGTEATGYPASNVRTLAVNQRGRITTDGTNGTRIDFDRFTANGNAINCVYILNNNMSGSTWNVYADDNSGFASATTLISASSTIATDIFQLFDGGATNTERYVRFDYDQTSGTYDYGLIGFGFAYEVATYGPRLADEVNTGTDPQRWTRSFRTITRANAEAIIDRLSRFYIEDTTDTNIDAFGGGGGRNPILVVDDTNQNIYYGRVRSIARPSAPAYEQITIDMELIRGSIFG